MKKKVLFLIPSLGGGGAERVYTHLLNHIDRERFDLYLIVVKLEGPYVDDLPKDIKVINLKKSSVKWSLIKLIFEINKIKPHVIMSTLLHLNLALLLVKPFLKGKPKVIVREANPPSYSRKSLSKGWLYKWLFKRLYDRADQVVAISGDVAEDTVRFFKVDRKKVHIIHNPLVIDQVKSESNEHVHHPWLLDKKEPVLVSVGRLSEQKDFPTLIQAFAKTLNKKRCKLLILGEGPNYNKLIALCKKLSIEDHVDFLGFKKNPYKYVKQSDLFVLSSKWEGFGMVFIEALAVGTPIVATDCSGGPREILNDGEFGVLTPVGDIEKLSDAMIKSLEKKKDKEKLVRRAKEFDITSIKRQYEQVFDAM